MIEAMKQALEAMETPRPLDDYPPILKAYAKTINEAIKSLRQAIAEAEKQVQNEPDDEVLGFNGWGFPIEHPPKPTPANKEQIREALVFNLPLYTHPQPRKPLTDERLELIGHADLAINNIYIFNGYGEDVPEGRTPIYAGYKTAHDIKE